jgi:hypothetical protein
MEYSIESTLLQRACQVTSRAQDGFQIIMFYGYGHPPERKFVISLNTCSPSRIAHQSHARRCAFGRAPLATHLVSRRRCAADHDAEIETLASISASGFPHRRYVYTSRANAIKESIHCLEYSKPRRYHELQTTSLAPNRGQECPYTAILSDKS